MTDLLAKGDLVSIRLIQQQDLPQIAPHGYSVSITEPLTDIAELRDVHAQTHLWQQDSGAVAIVDSKDHRLLGTLQFFRSGPCIHGFEIGYIIHAEADRGFGFATQGLELFTSYLFDCRPEHHRLQLTISTENLASCKVAEKCGYVKEGVLRASGFGEGVPPDCFVFSKVRASASGEL